MLRFKEKCTIQSHKSKMNTNTVKQVKKKPIRIVPIKKGCGCG